MSCYTRACSRPRHIILTLHACIVIRSHDMLKFNTMSPTVVDHLGGTIFWSVFGLKTGTPKCGLLLTLPASYICTIRIRGDYGGWPSTGRECRQLQGLAFSRPKLETVTGFGPRLVHLDKSSHQSGQIWLQLQGLAPDLSDLRVFKIIIFCFF